MHADEPKFRIIAKMEKVRICFSKEATNAGAKHDLNDCKIGASYQAVSFPVF